MNIIIIAIACSMFSTSVDSNSDASTDVVAKEQARISYKIRFLKKRLWKRHADLISKFMYRSAKNNNVPINAVISIAYIESGFQQGAKGAKKDTGIMQVMPGWSKLKLCKSMRLWHAEDNIECGCRVLRYYINRFNGSLVKGITAYNIGEHDTRVLLKHKVKLQTIWYTKLILWIIKRLDRLDGKAKTR